MRPAPSGGLLAGAVAAQKHLTGMGLSEVAANALIGLEPAYEALGGERAEEVFDEGMRMSLDEAVALARSVAEPWLRSADR